MWLINVETLELEYFIGPEAAPAYAILSHTWGDEEVTFQEFQHLDMAKLNPGFTKIQKACDLARGQDGLQYAWVDTCCIDKTSSAELSESINSMYDWYRQSKICYAYLNDWDSDSEQDWEKLGALWFGPKPGKPQPLRWFTRGWTLQELIAPARITFYDKSWNPRGTKSDSSVIFELSRITGINSRVLRDGSEENLRRTPLGQRMSWASFRETTRKEDLAYCLIGIFQANMPLLYGEGERAFLRLQEEIIKTSTDFSLFAWNQLAEARSQIGGILSRHPRNFSYLRSCTLTLPLFHAQESEEAVLTNKGLRVHTSSLFSVERDFQTAHHWVSDHCYLSLGCTISGEHAYIYLRRISDKVYIRVYPGSTNISSGAIGRRLEPQTIYIVARYNPMGERTLANGPLAVLDESPDKHGLKIMFDLASNSSRCQFAEMWPQGLFRQSNSVQVGFTVAFHQFDRFVGYLRLSICSPTPGLRFPDFIVVVYKLHPTDPVSVHLLSQGDAEPLLSLKDWIQDLSPGEAERTLLGKFEPTSLPGKIDFDPSRHNKELMIQDETQGKPILVAPIRCSPDKGRGIYLILRDT